MNCSAIGERCKIAVQGGSSPRTFNSSSERYAFIREDIKPTHAWNDNQWGAGEIAPTAAGNRRKLSLYSGSIVLEGSRLNLQTWIPRALWSASSSSADSTNYEFDVLVNRENGVFRYNNCLVDSLTIISDVNTTLCYMVADVVAQTESRATAWPSPEPSVPTSNNAIPYAHFESALTINSVDIPLDSVIITISNKLTPVARGSLTAQKFRSYGREIHVSGTSVFDSTAFPEVDALLTAFADATLTYTNAAIGTSTLSFQNFQNIKHVTPVVLDNKSIPVPFLLRAHKDNLATPEVSTTFSS